MDGCGLLSSSKETRAEVDADGCPSVGTWLSDEEPEIGIIGRTRDRDGDGARDGVLDGVREAGPKDSQTTISVSKNENDILDRDLASYSYVFPPALPKPCTAYVSPTILGLEGGVKSGVDACVGKDESLESW